LAARSRSEWMRPKAQAADAYRHEHVLPARLHRDFAPSRGGRTHSPRRERVPRDAWAVSTARVDLSAIKNVVAVHRLREVSCLYGFTRFEAAPTSADGELEDIQLPVSGAPLAQGADWLPAIEEFGEGIFIHFDEAVIGEWLTQNVTRRRHEARDRLCPSAQPFARAHVRNRSRLRLSR